MWKVWVVEKFWKHFWIQHPKIHQKQTFFAWDKIFFDQCNGVLGAKTFLIISGSVLLKMRNFTDISCRENQNTHLVFSNFYFKKSCSLFDKYKNIVELGRSQMTIWRIHIACRIPKATNTHSEYAILIALPLQQWWHECTSTLSYSPFPVMLIFTVIWFHLATWSERMPLCLICVMSSVLVCSSTFS